MQKPNKILLGITGSIAAYKAAYLVSLLKQNNYEVKVVMTSAATKFIQPLTFSALSGHPVYNPLFTHIEPMAHIDLARWADLIIVAPASANFIAKLNAGICDELLTTLCLAADSPILIAPAMNQQMWSNPINQKNIASLKSLGIELIGPNAGLQACGEEGPGRMTEPEQILQTIASYSGLMILKDKQLLITAGPTHEAIDPVRYISNRSSGKMGYALANAAIQLGANVTLISGPTHISPPAAARFISIKSCAEMREAVMKNIGGSDLFISSAAVSDFKPETYHPQKIKKHQAMTEIKLNNNPDILAEASQLTNGPIKIGFAAETENIITNATAKLKAKNLDYIVANQVGENLGFEQDQLSATLITRSGETIHFDTQNKAQLAHLILTTIVKDLKQNSEWK